MEHHALKDTPTGHVEFFVGVYCNILLHTDIIGLLPEIMALNPCEMFTFIEK